MKDKCHYIQVKGVGKVFIPGCMGGAVYGIEGCTCGDDPIRCSCCGQKLPKQ